MTTASLSASDLVHRLLFRALLEMRAQGDEQRNKVVFHLADIFHNVVLEMQKAARGECSYDDVLGLLEQRVREQHCERWLEHNLADLATEQQAKFVSGA